jgi:photosystem II stability/assembly factor-like uncharacterized protein
MKKFLIGVAILLTVFKINCFAQITGWELVQSNTTEDLNSIYFYDYQYGFAVGNSGTVLKSVDSGKTWQSLQSLVTFNLNDCVLFSESCFRAVGDSASWVYSSDGGNSWSYQILDLVDEIYAFSFFLRAQNFYDGIYGADSQAIMTGSSTYCADIINDLSKIGPGGFYATYMLSPNIGFVAGENSISQPIIGRANNYPQGRDFVSFYLDGNEGRATGIAFTDSLIGYISAIVWDGRGAIAKSIDNGDTWTTKFFNHPLHSISFPISGTSQIGYCVGDSGTILKTTNAGENWYNQISPTSERLNKVYFVDQNFGFAVGDNGTILRTTDGGVTHIDGDKNNDSPTEFLLYQNFPNPFNPTTTIKYQIPERNFVSIKVFDIIGNEIENLVDEEMSHGKYEVKFDGSGLSSGIYFYQLKCGSFTQTKKMLLINKQSSNNYYTLL